MSEETPPTLKPAQERALLSILAGKSFEAVAAEVGVNSSTIRRWRKEPLFQAALDSERRRLVASTTDTLRQAGIEAVTQLRAILADPNCPAAVKVQAAGCVLAHLFRAVEVDDLASKIEALEERDYAIHRP